MELVLGLAALATAISSVGGASHVDSSPEIVEAEPQTVQIANDAMIQGTNNLPKSHIGNLAGASSVVIPRGRPIDNWEHLMYESENNNSFANSNDAGIYNYTFSTYQSGDKPTSYYKTVYGSIGQEGDVDYYKFTIYGKANVTITLSDIPSQCDYDLRLYEQGTGLFSAAQAINEIGSSTRGSNNSESLTRFLYPNTYYIKVYSFKGYGSPYYNLGLNVSYQRGEDQNISDLKNMGSKGALWLSDWDPYGIKPSISDSRAPIGSEGHWYRQYSRTESARGNFDSTHFTFPIQTGVYKHAQLFIWDDSLRTQMLTLVTQLHDNAVAQVNTEYEFKIQTEIDELANGTVLSIMGFITIVGTVISIMQISYDLVKGIWDIVCPPEDMLVTKTNFLNYLTRLKEALTWYYPQGDSRVLSIPMRYTVIKKVNESKGYPTTYPLGSEVHSTNYYLTYQPVDPNESFEYTNPKIYVQDPENPFTGTIFPIADNDAMHKALARETYDMSFETFDNNGQKTLSLSSGKYKWYKFTAPRAGNYYFKSEGSAEATIDVFDNMVYGKSEHHMKARAYKNNGLSNGAVFSEHLIQGQACFIRISGGNGSYSALSSTTIKTSDTPFPQHNLTMEADVFNLGTTWDNVLRYNTFDDKDYYYIQTYGTFFNTDRNCIEMRCDKDGVCSSASIMVFFNRKIKRLSFGTFINSSNSNVCIPLEVRAFDDGCDTVQVDYLSSCRVNNYYPYNFNYESVEGAGVYGFAFNLDPNLDQSPGQATYQEQFIGGITVEFFD